MRKWRKTEIGNLIYAGKKYIYAIGKPANETLLLLDTENLRVTLPVKSIGVAKKIVELLEQ